MDSTNSPNYVSNTLRWLAHGHHMIKLSSSGYFINDYCFYRKTHDDECIIQNSGAILVVQSMHIFSTEDKNLIFASMSYYRVI